ncbi:hypothetical protein WICPIJ_001385 [Wickerhamomyces pijperi]|uniref:Protein AF-9 homolog n=1 Tax=Wickerhamomyces pijperi TaxID=599730 RepID=A0A9P8QAW2_WICPI|nr:hypothetical protein WICPIJ_001385 [Wickerhamomyces pijperi]
MAPQPSPTKRIKTLSLSCPIIYGNTARLLTAEERASPSLQNSNHTHKWTVFVHHPTLDDTLLTPYIKKVTFKLHDTYNNSNRVIEQLPFEVTETGWGEFDIVIRIHLCPELGEKANLTITHRLQLHPYGSQVLPPGEDKEKQIIRSVQYEEIVFNEPTEVMFERVTKRPGNLIPEKPSASPAAVANFEGDMCPLDANTQFSKMLERQELHRLNAALGKVSKQVEILRTAIVDKRKDDISRNVADHQ